MSERYTCQWIAQLDVRTEAKAQKVVERLIERLAISPTHLFMEPDIDIPGYMAVIHNEMEAESWCHAVVHCLHLLQTVSRQVNLADAPLQDHACAYSREMKVPGVCVLEVELKH